MQLKINKIINPGGQVVKNPSQNLGNAEKKETPLLFHQSSIQGIFHFENSQKASIFDSINDPTL